MNDLSELFKLSVAERIQLVEDLWDSIAADTEALPPLTEEQIAEIERRLAEHEKNPERAHPWEEVRERLWSKYR
jgi:putative addiction module component (TIGR02574 family)